MLSTIKHVLICSPELKKLLSQLTTVLSDVQKQLKFVDTTVKLTINTIDNVTIRAQRLGVMLLLGMTVRVMSVISWIFPVDDLTELLNLFNLKFS